MTSLTQDLQEKLKKLTVFERIIILNVLIYVVGWCIHVVKKVPRNDSLDWLSLPDAVSGLLYKPWSIITYAFAHLDLWHLALNMLVLYFIGRSLSNLFKSSVALSVYVFGILAGAIAFILVTTLSGDLIIKNTDGLVGASAAIRAVLIFVAFYMPNYEVQLVSFKFPLKYVAYFIIVIDVLGLVSTNAGGYVSHLGGDLIGYIYATQLLKGNDIGSGLQPIIERFTALFKPKSKHLKTVYKKDKKLAGMSKEEFSSYNNQKQIDLILDKISKSGYESLTADEKEFLFRAGKNKK